MLIIPAIDLKDGKVVRLRRGNFDEVTVYFDNPLEAAEKWRSEGAELLHIVDLDGACAGEMKNLKWAGEIIKSTRMRVEFGGGVRDIAAVKQLLDLGAERIILGTAAIMDERFLNTVLEKIPEKVIISIDVKEGRAATHGWRNLSAVSPGDLVASLIARNARRFVYTDVSRDGMLSGPNLSEAKRLFSNSPASFIVSGGISSLDDIGKIISAGMANVEGIIAGKALYENKFRLSDAIRLVQNSGI